VDDIPLLVEYLLERYAKKAGKRIRQIRKKTLELLQAYDWPGNIRELQNVIERAVILSDGDTFSVEDTWFKGESSQSGPTVSNGGAITERESVLVHQEKKIIEAALAASEGRISGPVGAAARLGIPRQTLDSKIRALRIDKRRFKTS
jgi:formate hydrogenlyase transcriptional activator